MSEDCRSKKQSSSRQVWNTGFLEHTMHWPLEQRDYLGHWGWWERVLLPGDPQVHVWVTLGPPMQSSNLLHPSCNLTQPTRDKPNIAGNHGSNLGAPRSPKKSPCAFAISLGKQLNYKWSPLFLIFTCFSVLGLSCGRHNLRSIMWDLRFWGKDSLVWHMGLSNCGAWAWWPPGMWDLSTPTRDRTQVPCVGMWILNHWATRKSLEFFIFKHISICVSIATRGQKGRTIVLQGPCYLSKFLLDVGGKHAPQCPKGVKSFGCPWHVFVQMRKQCVSPRQRQPRVHVLKLGKWVTGWVHLSFAPSRDIPWGYIRPAQLHPEALTED